jgi:hypothetical protein
VSQDASTTEQQPGRPKGLAGVSTLIGSISPWPAVLGILIVQAGVARPMVGFNGFLLSLALGLAAVVTGAAALLKQRSDPNARQRRTALGGLAYGALVLVAGVIAAAPGAGAPAINDISTDLGDPPQFTLLNLARENRGSDMSYPEEFVPIVREAYPDLVGVQLKVPMYIAHYRTGRAARELGWEVVGENPAKGSLEARAISRIFRFVDDVVVRVRSTSAQDEYSIVDIRSRSRDGRGDLGANAARIREFLARL